MQSWCSIYFRFCKEYCFLEDAVWNILIINLKKYYSFLINLSKLPIIFCLDGETFRLGGKSTLNWSCFYSFSIILFKIVILNGKVDHYTINHFEFGKKKFCAITYLISAKHLLITYLYHFYDIEINLIITLSIFNVPNFFCQKRSSSSSASKIWKLNEEILILQFPWLFQIMRFW